MEVDGGGGGHKLGVARLGRDALHCFDDQFQVGRCSTTAATHDVDAKVTGEVDDLRRESFGRLVVVHLAIYDRGQAGIGKHRDGERRILAKVADALGHVTRTRAAVHTNYVNRKRRKRR